jgi:hypothetical protein
MFAWTSLVGRTAKPGSAHASWFDEEEPLRAELFSADQMAQHGAALARRHRVSAAPIRYALLGRLALNERVLS